MHKLQSGCRGRIWPWRISHFGPNFIHKVRVLPLQEPVPKAEYALQASEGLTLLHPTQRQPAWQGRHSSSKGLWFSEGSTVERVGWLSAVASLAHRSIANSEAPVTWSIILLFYIECPSFLWLIARTRRNCEPCSSTAPKTANVSSQWYDYKHAGTDEDG